MLFTPLSAGLPDLEWFLSLSMVELLTLHANCSLVTLITTLSSN